MDFNKNRFLAFGRLDFVINKAFYRSVSLTTILSAIAIAFIGFFVRWLTAERLVGADGVYASVEDLSCTTWTTVCLSFFLSVCHAVFAGCTFHNLRNKQGRILELTIPASEIEKFAWHILVSIAGGLAIIATAVLSADLFNALLNLIFHPIEAQHSITWDVIKLITATKLTLIVDGIGENMASIFIAIRFMMLSIMASGTAFFVLGNAIKYKYNIIMTYLIYEFSVIILSIAFAILVAPLTKKIGHEVLSADQQASASLLLINIFAIINLLLTALYTWWSYLMYRKAQITSSLNK